MPSFRLVFHLTRKVTCFVEAEAEGDIDDFMSENPHFNPIEDAPEMVDSDETCYDEESELGDYEIVEDSNVRPEWIITPGLALEEIE